jgi:SPX domain protein involved in polyphosphate accumulation
MKYGKTLRQEKIEKFSMHYLQYKELKRKIKEIHRLLLSDKSMTDVRMKQHPLEIGFMTLVDAEVQKVNSFSTKMVGDLRMKVRPCRPSHCVMDPDCNRPCTWQLLGACHPGKH